MARVPLSIYLKDIIGAHHQSKKEGKEDFIESRSMSAILYILLYGNNVEAYNVTNEETYISIREVAEFLCYNFNPQIEVKEENHQEMGYAPVTKLNLSTLKLKELGCMPKYDLKVMYRNLIKGMKYDIK